MFTGIIQSIGILEKVDPNANLYFIKTNLDLNDCKVGSSICCDGVCLTATSIIDRKINYLFEVNVGEETLKRSNLSNWKAGSQINIEKSLKVGDEISGHFVYGHVDSTLVVSKIENLINSWEFEFSFTDHPNIAIFNKHIVEKGSISINGISLTVANIFKDSFNVSIIPHTYNNTNLFCLKQGDKVNIEFDPLARYISKNYGN